ncbi:MAG: mannonate dehydratase [Sulfobacillus acidophilus]|uniref:mannonate dehydratase n=1 Tax=Sulfobacillus acidophilus TaxID=53633 RepID=A0A2T2WDU3_9FIRM|nr:MAG: mannonate dehydratase [Sulfobacillus acidophilus]
MIRFAEILTEAQPTPFWTMLKQIGVTEVVGVLPRKSMDWRQTTIDHPWDYTPLAVYKEMIEEEGLTLTAIEDNPPMDRLRYGAAGAEEEFEQVVKLIENMGKLGISIWCYNWAAALGWLRSSSRLRGRGDAIVSGYDDKLMQAGPPPLMGTVSKETLWNTLEQFLNRIVPIAERAGVKLALHPDDPPGIPEIRGVSRIMNSVDAFERLLSLNSSEVNGITLCQGNFTLMTDNLPKVIRELGSTKRVYFVHFRDVMGTPTHFVETFIDNGKTDMVECMRAYRDVDFDGIMRSDHTPTLAGDNADVAGYSVLGRLHALGYMTGVRESVLSESNRPRLLADSVGT